MKILLAYDGSLASDHALEEAALLCDKLCADLALLRVVEEGRLDQTDASAEVPARLLTPRAQAALKDARERAAATGARVWTVLRQGQPAEEILELAAELGAAYIVLGASAKSEVTKFLLGSVSRSVAEQASCNVLLVK